MSFDTLYVDFFAGLSTWARQVDWVPVSEFVRNVVLSVAGATGAIVAWRGLSAWKQQKNWEYKVEVVAKIKASLQLYFKALDNFHKFDRARSRLEKKANEPSPDELENLSALLEAAISSIDEAYFGGVDVTADVNVLFGEEVQAAWQDFHRDIREIVVRSEKFYALTGIPDFDANELRGKLTSVEMRLLREVYLRK